MAFPVNGVIDDCNRADEGPPPTGWGDMVSGLVISSNQLAPSGPGNRSSYYATILTDDDCEVYATIGTAPANNRNMSLYARLTDIGSGTTDGYGVRLNKTTGTDTLQIVRMDNGSLSVLGADFSQELVDGDQFGLEIVGSTLTLYVNTGSGWSSLGSRTDSTYPNAGYLGADIGSGTLDDFGGGGLSAGGGGGSPHYYFAQQ